MAEVAIRRPKTVSGGNQTTDPTKIPRTFNLVDLARYNTWRLKH
jgi:hypothetical protein